MSRTRGRWAPCLMVWIKLSNWWVIALVAAASTARPRSSGPILKLSSMNFRQDSLTTGRVAGFNTLEHWAQVIQGLLSAN